MIKEVKLNIKKEVRERKLSEQEICNRLGRDRRYIYHMTEEVKLSKIIEIAYAIGCQPSDLLKGL